MKRFSHFRTFFMKMLKRSHMFPSLNSIRAQFVSQKLTGYRKIFVIIYGGKIVEVARSDLKMVQNSSFLSKVKNFEGVFGLAQTVHWANRTLANDFTTQCCTYVQKSPSIKNLKRIRIHSGYVCTLSPTGNCNPRDFAKPAGHLIGQYIPPLSSVCIQYLGADDG